MSEPTPCPLRVSPQRDPDGHFIVESNEHGVVATVEGDTPEQARATARMIAKSYNIHDELAAALREVKVKLESSNANRELFGERPSDFFGALDDLNQILAKLEADN